MRRSRLFYAAAMIAGLVSGPSVLAMSETSQPPLDWAAVAFAGVGSAMGIPLVLGFQAAARKRRALQFFWRLFLYTAVYMLAAGLAALVLAAVAMRLQPPAFMFVSLGSGMLVGVGLARVAFMSHRA